MLHSLTSQIGFVALLSTCAFAFSKGGYVERWAAGIIGVSWVLSVCISVVPSGFSHQVQEYTFLALDAATAVGLLVLAMLFAKVWLGVAMLTQSAELALHGAAMADWGVPFNLYMLLNNLVSVCLLLLLIGATATAWAQRVHARPSRPQNGVIEITT